MKAVARKNWELSQKISDWKIQQMGFFEGHRHHNND
jgi:hypothetical protein